MERMRCRFCKHFAEDGLTAWGMQQYKCTLHNIDSCPDACGCDWCNSNDNRCGSGADECGSIKNANISPYGKETHIYASPTI